MNRNRSAIHIFFVATLGLFAQSENDSSLSLPKNALGIVHLSIFPREGVINPKAKGVPARKTPEPSSPVLLTLNTDKDVSSSCEVGYEYSAAVVFSKSPGWFQIQTRMGMGWVSGKDAGPFIPVEKILNDRMSYLLYQEWKGVLYASPRLSSRLIQIKWKAEPTNEISASFLEWKWVENQPWIRVKLLAKPYCDGIPILDRDLIGWVPAYSTTGNLIMWYYSRGC